MPRLATAIGLLAAGVLLGWAARTSVAVGMGKPAPAVAAGSPPAFALDGWRSLPAGAAPETITALKAARTGAPGVYVGTRGDGAVHRLSPFPPFASQLVVPGVGRTPRFGASMVSALELADLDGDGQEELLGVASQESPPGPPHAFVWNERGVRLHAAAPSTVQSHWPHGLAVCPPRGGEPARFLTACCGHGEVVEFEPLRQYASARDMAVTGLGSRVVGKLGASGEQMAAVAWLGEKTPQLVLARGFGTGTAELLCYRETNSKRLVATADPAEQGLGQRWKPWCVLDEGGRFGNVRFVARPRDAHRASLFAWWCTDRAGGAAEFVRYRLDRQGVYDRQVLARGPADELWPLETQIAWADADGDGAEELWFATAAGHVRRWRPPSDSATPPAPPETVFRFAQGAGPLAAGPRDAAGRQPLYLAIDRELRVLAPPAPR